MRPSGLVAQTVKQLLHCSYSVPIWIVKRTLFTKPFHFTGDLGLFYIQVITCENWLADKILVAADLTPNPFAA